MIEKVETPDGPVMVLDLDPKLIESCAAVAAVAVAYAEWRVRRHEKAERRRSNDSSRNSDA